jgi:hypothetical protein
MSNWKTLQPAGRSQGGSEINYAIRKSKSDAFPRLSFSIRPDVARKMKCQNGERLRLESSGTMARLLRAGGQAAKALGVEDSGRARWECTCSGGVAAVFGTEIVGMTELTLVEVSSEAITFELPKK